MAKRIRIKDIAERAGVSVGTVDRVLHDRPNISKQAREKVEKALKEMDYQPNMYASALAYNKSYTFYMLLPKHDSEAYWEEIEEGAKKCEEVRRDFHINVEIRYYERLQEDSFHQESEAILADNPEGLTWRYATTNACRKIHSTKRVRPSWLTIPKVLSSCPPPYRSQRYSPTSYMSAISLLCCLTPICQTSTLSPSMGKTLFVVAISPRRC